MISIRIDKQSTEATYKQIAREIMRAIDGGELAPGDPIDSIRKLAEVLGVAPATVKRAYDSLEQDRYLETILGKGSFVCHTMRTSDKSAIEWSAFWSYAHKDNHITNNRILDLAQDIRNEYSLRTGEDINLITDQTIEWGAPWLDEIRQKLENAAFFIPVLTPNYLNSTSCMKELKTAIELAKEIDKLYLVRPIIFVDIDRVLENIPDDELVNFLKDSQWKRWDQFAYDDRESASYRHAVREFVDTLIDADEARLKRMSTNTSPEPTDDYESSDETDLIGDIGAMEGEFDQLTAILDSIGLVLNEIGEIAIKGTKRIEKSDSRNGGFAGRLAVIKQMAQQYEDPADRLHEQSTQFTTSFQKINRGIHAMVPLLCMDQESGQCQNETVEEFYSNIESMYKAADEGFNSIEGLIQSISEPMAFSRDLRRPLGRIKRSLDELVSNRKAIESWKELIESNKQRCEG